MKIIIEGNNNGYSLVLTPSDAYGGTVEINLWYKNGREPRGTVFVNPKELSDGLKAFLP